MPVAEVEGVIKAFKTEFSGAAKLDFIVKRNEKDAFGRRVSQKRVLKGGYYPETGRVIILADNLSSPKDIRRKIRKKHIICCNVHHANSILDIFPK